MGVLYNEPGTKFIYGKLLAVNDQHYVLASLTPDEAPDGLICRSVESLLRVETGSQYAMKM